MVAAWILVYNACVNKRQGIIEDRCACHGCVICGITEVFEALFVGSSKARRKMFLFCRQDIDREVFAFAQYRQCSASKIYTDKYEWWIERDRTERINGDTCQHPLIARCDYCDSGSEMT